MSADIRSRVQAIAKGEASDSNHGRIDAAAAKTMAPAIKVLTDMASSKRTGRPIHMPSEAFGIWG